MYKIELELSDQEALALLTASFENTVVHETVKMILTWKIAQAFLSTSWLADHPELLFK